MFFSPPSSELFFWEGRIGRGQFWRTYFLWAVPEFFIGILARVTASGWLEWLLWSVYIFGAFIMLFLIIKRLHDVGKTGWWSLFLLVPFVNVYIIYLLFFKKSVR